MDGKRFDALTQRLGSIRITRGSALRGAAAGALALTGMAKFADEASAKKRKYCDCVDENDQQCTNEKAGRKARKRYLRDHPCSYKGECRGTGSHNPCEDAGTEITVNIDLDLLGIGCGILGECGILGTTGLLCNNDGVCVPEDCQDIVKVCGSGNDLQCCVADASCIDGLCVLELDKIP